MAVRPEMMATDWFQKAAEAVDAAVKTSMKFQEEAMQWWAEVMGGANSIQDWQKRAQAMAAEAIPTAQRGAEEYLRAMDQTYRTGVDVFKKAFQSGECRSVEDLQARMQSLWEAALGALRTNTQAFIQANTKAMETWADMVRKNASEQSNGSH
ncbi:MAG TPA: hypothetical protein PL151_14090 [Phycisphaerae bacterium]|nr:hypothetical protein [Phycisphaerae bacterium]HOJ73485.1 hypothetical protein [Phycisphaerae bacterium]HOM51094.1 hypothetical protein [Phycisphaerae bacterium]HON66758.1 hypothetical protein [Phycisphaerae bacterium]HOQ85279.1 hypothetical protein [Phycisphaerae bacterium]